MIVEDFGTPSSAVGDVDGCRSEVVEDVFVFGDEFGYLRVAQWLENVKAIEALAEFELRDGIVDVAREQEW